LKISISKIKFLICPGNHSYIEYNIFNLFDFNLSNDSSKYSMIRYIKSSIKGNRVAKGVIMSSENLQRNAVNTLRFLSVDAVQKANSGHPGLPMGAAAMAYTIWTHHLRHNPENPGWANRDRFILSGGHGSMLLYSLLYLNGYDLSLDQLKEFRQWNSLTPGHPEYGHTPGVEVTTGPLGQGFANGVGFAIAERHLAALFNRPGFEVVDHYTYAIVTDGDLSEGIASEAASLAGHLKLGKLIYLYDDNHITIDGGTDIAFTEDRGARFEAYGWYVQEIKDGNNIEEINKAIERAKNDSRPSLIMCRTIIGYGAPNLQGTSKVHGEPLGEVELTAAKENLGWPLDTPFYVPDDVLNHFRIAKDAGRSCETAWNNILIEYEVKYPKLAAELKRRLAGKLPADWDLSLPDFPVDIKGMATRAASGKTLNAIARKIPELIGGSADLAPSNKSWIDGEDAFQFESPQGRNFHFGVREHAMGGVVNGMAVHGGVVPYGATFLVFSDYMRGALRLSALSKIGSIWVFTHDSIGVGEDGPTHQPVEHVTSLRIIPNLVTLRPGDANETAQAWKIAIERRNSPTALILSRQSTPTLDRTKFASANNVSKGAYVLADLGKTGPEIILMASGTELDLIVRAGEQIAANGTGVRLVSMPSWELFLAEGQSYIDDVLPPSIKLRIAVEAGVTFGWERWVGTRGFILGVNRFGASAPADKIYKEYGLTVENVVAKAKLLLS
jgi:transketolase